MLKTVATAVESYVILGLSTTHVIINIIPLTVRVATFHALGYLVGIQRGKGLYHMGIKYGIGTYTFPSHLGTLACC